MTPAPVKITNHAYENQPGHLTRDIGDGTITAGQVSQLELAHCLDPQHWGRQVCLDQLQLVQGLNPNVRHMWSPRGYVRWDSHTNWNPYSLPVIGPQWGNDWYPNEHDTPDRDFESVDYFRGHMKSAGWKQVGGSYRASTQLPYLFHYSKDAAWKNLNPYEYRPYCWVMQWHDRNWRNRLADYHRDFAVWVESQMPGKNHGLMLTVLKSSHYWTVSERRRRINDLLPPPKPLGQQRGTASILEFMSRYDWKFNIQDKLNGSHIAYPLTNQAQWLYGVCSIPGKLRYRLDRAGLRHWQVILDLEYVWTGSTYVSLIQSLDDDEQLAKDHIRINLLKAAANCDAIIWPKSNMSPWVLELQDDMADRCRIISQVDWPA